MSKSKISAATQSALLAAVATYQKAGANCAAAMEATRAADVAAVEAQAALREAREDVAHLLTRAGIKSARCAGLLLSVDPDEGELIACEDKFVTIG